MDVTEKEIFYRYHPITHQDANIFDTEGLLDKEKIELAQMIRQGARFYWKKSIEGYSRCEFSNVKFALDVAKIPYEFID